MMVLIGVLVMQTKETCFLIELECCFFIEHREEIQACSQRHPPNNPTLKLQHLSNPTGP